MSKKEDSAATQSADTVGIIGVGHLASALVTGLVSASEPPAIVLSPRSSEKAERLAAQFGLAVARDNTEVVERSEIVLLVLRPADVLDAIKGLPWRTGHTVISVAVGVTLSALAQAVRPAKVVRALPITAAEIGESPTCMIPDDAAARALFERLGTVHAFDDEATYDLASTHGVVYSVFHALIGSTVEWFEASGLPGPEARRLSALAVRAAAGMIVARPELGLDAMVEAFARPGSLTLLALQRLSENGVLRSLPRAWSVALERCREIGAAYRT